MANSVTCDVKWSEPQTRKQLEKSRPGEGNFVYAITVGSPSERGLVRIGASADVGERMKRYKVLDFIPSAQVFCATVSDAFKQSVTPLLRAYYAEQRTSTPKFLRDKPLDACVARELRFIEYKVESLLLRTYQRTHGGQLPPGNDQTGPYREYLTEVDVVESGAIKALGLPRAKMPPLSMTDEQVFSLLW